jgi:aryl-alcohol dehydrogenase-like predicted oxidoreductase
MRPRSQVRALATRRLGTDGPEITTVGFGAWAAGGGGWAFGWGPQDDADSIAAIRHAVAKGVSWIDTAAVYGYGHSEEVVGRALADIPRSERPLVFTKCGLRWDERDRMATPVQDSSPARVRAECQASLERLGIETIDLYQFHWPDQAGVPVEDSWGEMLRLVEEGKVRWAGVSNYDPALLERCERRGHVQSLQPPFSLVRRDAAASEIPWCAANGTGVIVYSPMQAGLLTDSFAAERAAAFPPDDWRRRSPQFQPPHLARNLALRDALRPIAAKHGVKVAAVAVAWTLAWPGVTGAIVGARSPEQVDGWLGAAGLTLDEADLSAIAAAISRIGAGSGPLAPARAGR